jgi:Flp pilus assembly protein TadG
MLFHGELVMALIAGASASATAFLFTYRLRLRRYLMPARRLTASSESRNHVRLVPVKIPGNERGQTLVEFAFAFPLLFLFLLVMLDFGIALDRREVIQHAVREGARRAAVDPSLTNIIDHTVDQSQGTLEAGKINVCYVDDNSNNPLGNAGDSVQVSAEYTYEFSIGGGEMLAVWGVPAPTIDMSPSAQARLEKSMPVTSPCPP